MRPRRSSRASRPRLTGRPVSSASRRARLPLDRLPIPAYHLLDLRRYFIASVQFSSGCPYRCEFCDIPELYGRSPRLKTPAQLLRELDAILAAGPPGAIYFVDDNFVGNQRAALELLPHIIVDWQRRTGYPVQLACEATLNLAMNRPILELMREARFITVFCGIETPEARALHALAKDRNLRLPILEAVRAPNDHGLAVVSGIILGLDTDTEETPDRIVEFVEASRIPMLTINILHALPKTPLWRRLAAEGRLIPDGDPLSNARFRMAPERVRAAWLRCVEEAFRPASLYARYEHNARATYAKRRRPAGRRATGRDLGRGAGVLARLLWRVGIRSDYRDVFWRFARPALREGRIEELVHVGLVAHHLIRYARDCPRGRASTRYQDRPVAETV